MPLPREVEGTQSDGHNAPGAAVDLLTTAKLSIDRKGLFTLNQVAAHVVLAADVAKQIQDMELIHLPPNFPKPSLQAAIRERQMTISDYAGRFRGPIRQRMTTAVFDILQFSNTFVQLSEGCFEKFKCTEEMFPSEKKALLACCKDMMEKMMKIQNGLNGVNEEISQVIAGLTEERAKLNECSSTYDEEQRNYEQKFEDERIERERLQRRIRELRSRRRCLILKAVAGVGVVILISPGIIILPRAVIGVGVVTAEKIQEACELRQEIRRLQAKLEGTPKERLLNISDELKELLQFSYDFKNTFDSVMNDWSQLSAGMKQTIELLQSAETKADNNNLILLINIELEAAKKNWIEVNKLAKELHKGCTEINTVQGGSNDMSSCCCINF